MTTRFADHLLEGDHASRPAASAVPEGTLYACSDHALVYQSIASTWGTWLDAGGASGDVSTDPIWDTKGDLAVATGSNTAAKLAAAANGAFLQTLSSEATGLIWRPAPVGDSVILSGGNYTSMTGSFGIITGATLSLTTLARRLRIGVVGAAQVGTSADAAVFDISIDGTYVSGGATSGLTGFRENSTGHRKNISFTVLTEPVTAAAHTIELHGRRNVGSGTITVFASSADTVLTFWAEETLMFS